MTPATELIIDMILFCPLCFRQHIDKDKPEQDWINVPHKSHRCDYCTYIWRPADVCTNGVAAVKTKGKADLPIENLPAMVSVQPLWCRYLTVQQQSVLFLATRGPDGAEKYHPCKDVQRAYRATVMIAAKYGRMIEYGEHVDNFMSLRSFADEKQWRLEVNDFFNNVDNIPHHFSMKLLHATEIVGYKHPDERFRERWHEFYQRGVYELHLNPETEEQLDTRLSDWNRADWPVVDLIQGMPEPTFVEAIKANDREIVSQCTIGADVMLGLDKTILVSHDESGQCTQNGSESEVTEQDNAEKILDPDGTACGCGYKNVAHPRPQGMEYNQRKLCNGNVVTLNLESVAPIRTQNGPE